MGFSNADRERALAAAARHCCVCHRYKGLKVEVHHIIPEASGGTNDYDNAIVLCFDCHCDAGHYNPSHPRGTKFSPGELGRQRDSWYDIVSMNRVAPASEQPVHCRYLICKSTDIIRDIAAGDLAHLPVERPFLATTTAGRFLQQLVERLPDPARNDQVWGDTFQTVADYQHEHPEVLVRERSQTDQYPYFQAVRIPSIAELAERVAPEDTITRLLVDADVRPEEISCALAYSEACGGEVFQEVYRLRPLWAIYLAITNAAGQSVALTSLTHHLEQPVGLGYRPFWAGRSEGEVASPLPPVALPNGATTVIPLAGLLGPLWPVRAEALWTESTDVWSIRTQDFSHGSLEGATPGSSAIGPALWPTSIALTYEQRSLELPIHQLDLENVYILSRSWECGSCPLLFVERGSPATSAYVSELFARHPGSLQEHRLLVPSGVTALILAELEDETAIVERVEVNGVPVCGSFVLEKGEVLQLPVQEGDVCCLRGRYEVPVDRPSAPWRRNELIHEFICDRDSVALRPQHRLG